jgi:hypothetical protein
MAKWIRAATANSHGQFRRKAEAAGETTRAFAAEKSDAPGKLGKQARLASSLMGLHHADGGPADKSEKLYGKKKVSRNGR